MDIEKHFWPNVQKGDGCWEWIGSRYPGGYGRCYVGNGRRIGAHRVSFAVANGAEAEGLVLHSCDNKGCVNPAHLRDGTQAENVADAFARGQRGLREKSTRGRLTEEQVQFILGSPLSQAALARMFSVTRQNIWAIKHGKRVPLSQR